MILRQAFLFLILINPVSKIAIINMLPKTMKKDNLHMLIFKSCLLGFFILAIFSFAGKLILNDLFQIDINALRFAGGLVLVIIGFRALDKGIFFRVNSHESLVDMAIVPLASPLIAGPATIAATIYESSNTTPIIVTVSIFIAVLLNMVISLMSLKIKKVLDKYNLMGALIRITGLLVMSMGVNMVFHGIKSFFFS